MVRVCKFDLIVQSDCVDYEKLKVLIADFSGHYDSLNALYLFVELILINYQLWDKGFLKVVISMGSNVPPDVKFFL